VVATYRALTLFQN